MPFDEILIAPLKEGQRRDVDSWLLPNEAFRSTENVYSWRGIITKRGGTELFDTVGVRKTSAMAKQTDKRYTVTIAHAEWADVLQRSVTVIDVGGTEQELHAGEAGTFTGDGTGTVNFATGAIDITFTENATGTPTTIYHYSYENAVKHIRGIFNMENSNGEDHLVVCDRNVLSAYDTAHRYFDNIPNGAASYTYFGNKSSLFRAHAWKNVLYLTDGIDTGLAAGIFSYDGSVVTKLTPQHGGAGTNVISYCLDIRPYHRRMLMAYTIEDTGTYKNRIRWSKLDDPASWSSVTPGEGGGLDAATNEAIVATGIVHDVYVVAFERSVWAFEYTGGNPPFRWKRLSGGIQINSTYGMVELDDMVVFVGQNGIYGCDGSTVRRIDDKIPEFMFNNVNLSMINELTAVHDKNFMMSIMSYPSTTDSIKNDRTLVFSHKDGWFSEYDIGLRALGTFAIQTGTTWSDISDGTTQWKELAGLAWDDIAEQEKEDLILGGDNYGTVYSVNDKQYTKDDGEEYDFSIESKTFSPYVDQGIRSRLARIDLLINPTNDTLNIDMYANENSTPYKTISMDTTSTSDKVWKRAIVNHSANSHAFTIRSGDSKLVRHKIHAIKLSFEPAGDIRL